MAYGFFVPIVRVCFGAFLLSQSQVSFAQEEVMQADKEGSLLHRQLRLTNLKKFDPVAKQWAPYTPPRSKVYVLNLWTTHCGPCRKEFPFLQKLVRGWKGNADVQFLFLADPPQDTSEAEVLEYWEKNRSIVPEAEPLRSESPVLRLSLQNDTNPITLILDEKLVVRQAFVGAVGNRPLGRTIERILQLAQTPTEGSRKLRTARTTARASRSL